MENFGIKQIFADAINREREAYTFYQGVADRVTEIRVKEIFSQLAEEERGHEEVLAKALADPDNALKFSALTDYKVAESVNLPILSLDMKPADAIALAMKKEQEAMEFYKKLADWTQDSERKDVLLNLSAMELGHKARLESLFVDIGYPEVW